MSRTVGALLVALGAMVALAAFGGMLAAIAGNVRGEAHSALPSFVWFLFALVALAAGRAVAEEGR